MTSRLAKRDRRNRDRLLLVNRWLLVMPHRAICVFHQDLVFVTIPRVAREIYPRIVIAAAKARFESPSPSQPNAQEHSRLSSQAAARGSECPLLRDLADHPDVRRRRRAPPDRPRPPDPANRDPRATSSVLVRRRWQRISDGAHIAAGVYERRHIYRSIWGPTWMTTEVAIL